MKRSLPEDTITNELKGRSAFFTSPTPIFTNQPTNEKPIDTVRTPERENVRTGERPRPTSVRRAIKRQSYNVYHDQHEALKRLEATSVLSGKGIFISEMVREALDGYLKQRQ